MVAVKNAETTREVIEFAQLPPREEIAAHHLIDEQRLLDRLLERAVFSEDERRRSTDLARRLVYAARADRGQHAGVDAFMREYGLSSEEGVILMCIAEALLRIPDSETADELIAEKLSEGHWDKHRGHSDSLLVNASTWALMLTGRVVKLREARGANPFDALKRLVARSGEPVIRQAVRQAVKVLGDQFVLGRTIREALARAKEYEAKGYLFSYDMLGEAARTQKDADIYFERYLAAIDAVGQAAGPFSTMHADALYGRPGLSIKLSALHRVRARQGRAPCRRARPAHADAGARRRSRGLPLTIDAEEQDRLDPTLEIFAATFNNPALDNWNGLGIAVQAYGKRAIPTLRWLRRLAERSGKRIPVRLVKGAYWDSEIKWAQERALADYPVFTRKLHTDVSFLACVRLLLSDQKSFYSQFATHNAYAIAAAHVAGGAATFEFQRLHGMGEPLHNEVVGDKGLIKRPCRIYAPVGGHEDLLAYLVRRLLENGANTSFINRLADDEAPVSEIIRDPVEMAEAERGGGAEPQRPFVPRATSTCPSARPPTVWH